MEQKEPDNSTNDEILNTGGSDSGANEPVSRKIPSFEEMISGQTDPLEDSILDDPALIEDDSDGSGMEILADTDWHLPGETVELAEDTAIDIEVEDLLQDSGADESDEMLMSSDEIDPSSPVVSKAEQDELLAEFHDIEKYDSLDENTGDDETEFVKEIEEGLAAMSETDKNQDDSIPKFNVYDRILSGERKESSTRRQGPGGNGGAKSNAPVASGTIGDIINNSKGIAPNAPPIETQPDNNRHANIVRGIIHGRDNMSDVQVGIISDIVAEHITEFYRKTG